MNKHSKYLISGFVFLLTLMVSSTPCPAVDVTQSVLKLCDRPLSVFAEQKTPRGFRIIALSHLAECLVNLRLSGAVDRTQAAVRMENVIRAALDSRVAPVGLRDPEMDLPGAHALYRTHLNIILNAWKRATGDPKYDALAGILSRGLAAESLQDPYTIIPSYNGQSLRFPADQAAVLYSLYLFDQNHGTSISARPIEKWLAFMEEKGTHPKWSLPVSEVTGGAGYSRFPRGCALSWTVRYMAVFAPKRAEALWKTYKSLFKIDLAVAAGFREWPPGVARRADLDSGPITAGIGAAATGIALVAAKAINDPLTYQQLQTTRGVIQSPGSDRTALDRQVVALSIAYLADTYRPWYAPE